MLCFMKLATHFLNMCFFLLLLLHEIWDGKLRRMHPCIFSDNQRGPS
jgi:hypothetical protein